MSSGGYDASPYPPAPKVGSGDTPEKDRIEESVREQLARMKVEETRGKQKEDSIG